MYALQTATDVLERKPWRSSGSEHIGKHARRFFTEIGVTSDGVIVGWLPPEGDDPALWHMVRRSRAPGRRARRALTCAARTGARRRPGRVALGAMDAARRLCGVGHVLDAALP